ncbi:MAG: homocysteine S-methyltransferase family protein [Dehalococcoidia bacterium]|nr:homocysteine S-methyltransferase family protein [Dehalococcoidia bacterium]
MADYKQLKSRIDDGEVIVLDGAIGTELQAMGVPMDPASWCGPGNYTHPATVRQMHERYIKAGADIITTNTFNTLRPALEASGYNDLVREINVRSVDAAIEARDRAAGDRQVYIAGSISCRIPVRDRRTGTLLGGTGYGYGASLSAEELRSYTDEQADILAESGVDFFLMENMWADNESRVIATEAAMATGLPVWVAFTASLAPDEETVRLSLGDDRNYSTRMGMPMFTSSWRTVDYDMTLSDGIDEITALSPDVIGVFHSRLDETTAALQVVLDRWSGPIVIYPDAGREDYLEVWQDSLVDNEDSTAGLTQEADIWVEMGAQVIGTCCGFGVDYIKALSGALPERVSSPRRFA